MFFLQKHCNRLNIYYFDIVWVVTQDIRVSMLAKRDLAFPMFLIKEILEDVVKIFNSTLIFILVYAMNDV